MTKRLSGIIFIVFVLWPGICYGKVVFPFEGKIDFVKTQFDISVVLQDQSFLKAKIKKAENNQYQVYLSLDHLKTPFFEISSEIESLVEIINEEEQKRETSFIFENLLSEKIKGKLWSKYSLIDYNPIRELKGNFEISDRILLLNSLSFGNLKFQGSVQLIAPYKIDLVIQLNDVEMDDFISFWVRNKKVLSSGFISGEIEVAGTLRRLYLKGRFESFNGFIKKLGFDSIHLNIEGYYPTMQIAQSVVSESKGLSYILDGPMDISDHKNFMKQIRNLTVSPIVSQSHSELEWTIKRRQETDFGTTELKYLLRRDLNVGSSGENFGMIGVERTVNF